MPLLVQDLNITCNSFTDALPLSGATALTSLSMDIRDAARSAGQFGPAMRLIRLYLLLPFPIPGDEDVMISTEEMADLLERIGSLPYLEDLVVPASKPGLLGGSMAVVSALVRLFKQRPELELLWA